MRSASLGSGALGDQSEGCSSIQLPAVERPASDGTCDDLMLGLQQRADIGEAGKAARRDDGDGDRARKRSRGRQVEARQDTVAIDSV